MLCIVLYGFLSMKFTMQQLYDTALERLSRIAALIPQRETKNGKQYSEYHNNIAAIQTVETKFLLGRHTTVCHILCIPIHSLLTIHSLLMGVSYKPESVPCLGSFYADVIEHDMLYTHCIAIQIKHNIK